MKQIISLYGKGHIGKTETLNLLIDLLKVATTGCSMPTPQATGQDRKETFNYNGKIISICTGGDDENTLKDNCLYFMQKGCDVAISAARSRGKTHRVLESLATKNNTSITWIKKLDNPNMNTQVAQSIFNLL